MYIDAEKRHTTGENTLSSASREGRGEVGFVRRFVIAESNLCGVKMVRISRKAWGAHLCRSCKSRLWEVMEGSAGQLLKIGLLTLL
jgi:hypothetical protein